MIEHYPDVYTNIGGVRLEIAEIPPGATHLVRIHTLQDGLYIFVCSQPEIWQSNGVQRLKVACLDGTTITGGGNISLIVAEIPQHLQKPATANVDVTATQLEQPSEPETPRGAEIKPPYEGQTGEPTGVTVEPYEPVKPASTATEDDESDIDG